MNSNGNQHVRLHSSSVQCANRTRNREMTVLHLFIYAHIW